MKKFILGTIFVLCLGGSYIIFQKHMEDKTAVTKTLVVEGMTCEACEVTLTKAFQKEKGIKSVTANYKTGEVTVRYIPKKIGPNEFTEILTKENYKLKSNDSLQILNFNLNYN